MRRFLVGVQSVQVASVAAVIVAVVAACGDNRPVTNDPDAVEPEPIDAAEVDAPPEPFAGRYDSADDFPREGCVAGSFAGFARADLWPGISLRTDVVAGALVTYRGLVEEDVEIPHTLTNDDLLLRTLTLAPRPRLDAFDLCRVDADGTLHGTQVFCRINTAGMEVCNAFPVVARPFRRPAGEGDGMHLTLLGEHTGTPAWPEITLNARVDGDTAYLARGRDGLRILDITDPAHPVERGHFVADGDYYNDLKLVRAGARRYVVAASSPCRVIDVTDPAAPFLAADIATSAHTLFVEGNMAYFASGGDNVVPAYDLTDPRAPIRRGEWTGGDFLAVHDLYVENRIAYLSGTDQGMIVVDFTDPGAPVEVGHEKIGADFLYWHSPWLTRIGGRPVIVHGDEGTDTRLVLLDGDPTSPTFLQHLGEWRSRTDVSIHNVMAFGERAYVAHYRDGIRVFDLSDVTNPRVVGYYNTWRIGTPRAFFFAGAFGVDVDLPRRRLYAADSVRGLMIFTGDTTVFP